LILSWVIPKNFKNGICCSLSLRSALKSYAEDKETVSSLYVSESKISLVLAP